MIRIVILVLAVHFANFWGAGGTFISFFLPTVTNSQRIGMGFSS